MASSSARASLPSAGVEAADAAVAFQCHLDAIFDEELAGLVERFQHARYRSLEASVARIKEMSTALKAAEAALADVRAELQAEREKMGEVIAAADVAAARAAGRIDGLRDTVRLQATRIVELDNKLHAQVAYSERLGARAARVPMLERRIAEGIAQEARAIEAARQGALQLFTSNEMPARLAQATEVGSVRGRTEGFQVGFHRALKMICDAHPELRAEAMRFSVQAAMAEVDAEAAANPQA